MSYRAFWQRSCRAAAAGAVLKPSGGNCAVLPLLFHKITASVWCPLPAGRHADAVLRLLCFSGSDTVQAVPGCAAQHAVRFQVMHYLPGQNRFPRAGTVTAIGGQFRHQGFQFLLGAFHGCAPAAAAHGNTGPDLPFPVFIRPGAVQGIPGIAAHVAVNFQPLFPLKPPHCGFGAGAVASIHIQSAQPALYQGNIRAGCPRPQHGSAIFRHCI